MTILLVLLCGGGPWEQGGRAQAQISCFVQTQLDRRNVYAQQPFKVTFTVLTATWYTAPLDFDNIQIPNAFIIPFDRTQSGMFPANGKQYSGLQFYFIVFPYVAGNYTIPSIKIVATTPAVGESNAQKVTLTTPPQPFVVKSEPAAFKGEQWFVAKDVTISQEWSKPLQDLKVGDVLVRTVTIDARGTLPQFIPAIGKDSLDWASVYPHEPALTDTRDQYDANGRLTQRFTYLLEKEGDYAFPAEQIKWWNPYSSKVYSRSTDSTRVRVKANPDLGILATLKDSLNATRAVVKPAPAAKKGPVLIYGIPWYWFALYALVALFLIYLLIRLIIGWYRSIRAAYAAYLRSEAYWFCHFMRSPPALSVFVKNLYAWWDRWPVAGKSSSIGFEAKGEIADELEDCFKELYGGRVRGASAAGELGAGSGPAGSERRSSAAEIGPAGAGAPAAGVVPVFKKGMKGYRKKVRAFAKNNDIRVSVSPDQREWEF